jgi:putative ubiquitin-RnfH superfamily antitoxin RatB of RatAB toxin-antitoxin module
VSADLLEVEVVYARPEQQVLIQLSVPGGSTARDAIIRSNILSDVPGLDLETLAVGIFARRVTLDYILKTGDRVEIYRPLTMSPVESRRWRAKLKTPQLD